MKKNTYELTHVSALDGLRGFAILALSLGHFLIVQNWKNEPLFKILSGGWIFVDCFFVLSGFLVTSILLKSKNKPDYFRKFYSRRQLRILPLYLFAVITVFLISIFIEGRSINLNSYDSFIWYLLYLPNIAITLKGGWLDNSQLLSINHFWAVGVEEQFYLLWPLIIYFTTKKTLVYLSIGILVLGTPIRYLTGYISGNQWGLAPYLSTWCRMDAIAAGALVALLLTLDWEVFKKSIDKTIKKLLWVCKILILCLLILILLKIIILINTILGISDIIELSFMGLYLSGVFYLWRWILKNKHNDELILNLLRESCKVIFLLMLTKMIFDIGYQSGHEKLTHSVLCFSSLIYILITSKPNSLLRKFFENKFLIHVGFFSYGIYLFHHMLRPIWAKTFEKWFFINAAMNPLIAQILYIIAVSACTYILARLSWKIIEQPFMKLKK